MEKDIKTFEYVKKNFDLLYKNLSCGICINYGCDNKSEIQIAKNVNASFFANKEDIQTENIIWKEWMGKKIPFIFDHQDKGEIITNQSGKIIINYDIIASAFYFLSGWNEYVNKQKDKFDRTLYASSAIKKLNIVKLPVVNYYFDVLKHAIEKTKQCNFKSNTWGNRDFGVLLSHDIDVCKRGWLEDFFHQFKKGFFLSAVKIVLKRIYKDDEWLNFKKISEIENNFNAKSSFYFLAKKGKVNKFKNADYNIHDKKLFKEIIYLYKNNHEIGVHGSFGSHLNSIQLINEKNKIGINPILGNRFHFLLFDNNKTVDVLEKSGLKYDTSLGFADQVGFRRGTCFPFYLYNFNKNCSSEVIEIPLMVMDTTLRNYMKIEKSEVSKTISDIIDEIKKFNGVLTILWHNNYFTNNKYKGWRELYKETLKICVENNALLTNGREILEKII